MGRDSTTPRDGNIAVRSPLALNGPVLIGGTTVSPTCGIMGSQEILSKYGSTDGNLAKNGDSTPIFSKIFGRGLYHDSISDI